MIIAENKAYDQIIGSPNTPILNQLGKTYGLAAKFYGEVHPSEANYIAMLGGSTFGIHDDDAFYCHKGIWVEFCSNSKLPDNNPQRKTDTQGCCGFDPNSNANFGGGHIATIVITNHGPRGVVDDTPYNHYSLLRTTEDAFGIYEYLNEAGNTDKGVKPMTPLFAVK